MDIDIAKKTAAKMIGYKMYTCAEVCRRLVQKGCNSETAEQVVAEFCKAGILDDEEYAKMYIHDAALIGLKGINRIKQELYAKGISRALVDRTAGLSDIDMEEQLENYISLRFGNAVFSDWKDIEKAKAHLARRGYGIAEINRCFKKIGIKVARGEEY
jgi:regulatory protein